jgi:nucleoside-diphosphate kinase
MERTLSIIKPDGVAQGVIGEVIKRFESNKIKIVAMKMIYMTPKEAQGFYAVHRERPFFSSLTAFMSSMDRMLRKPPLLRSVTFSTDLKLSADV